MEKNARITDDYTSEVEVAVMKEQISGLREQHKAHQAATDINFEKLNVKVDIFNKETDQKLDAIFETLNRGKGVFTASLIFAGFMGAIISKIFAYIFLGK